MSSSRQVLVGVLAGGPSSEREVSLRSGMAVYEALKKSGHKVVLVDLKDITENEIRNVKINAAFLALHGGAGEDGTVQKILEKLEIPYTGSDPCSSFKAMDKLESKRIFQDFKIPVPAYISVNKKIKLENLAGFHLPLVVKPTREGSSIGLTVVKEEKYFDKAMEDAFKCGGTVLIEKFIEGRELTVGIIGTRALPVVEIKPKDAIYDFNAKYVSKDTEYIVPAVLSDDEKKRAQKLALRAHQALGCRDYSRVDIRMDASGGMYVLEVNTLPGMTARSLLPKAAEADGMDFDVLCSTLLNYALKRRANSVAK